VSKLNAEIGRILREPDTAERLRKLGLEARTSTPPELTMILGDEIALYQKVIRDAGVKAD